MRTFTSHEKQDVINKWKSTEFAIEDLALLYNCSRPEIERVMNAYGYKI